MKAILEFNLPEEDEEFNTAMHGIDYKIILEELDNYLRHELKYNEDAMVATRHGVFQEIRDKLWELRNAALGND